MNLLAKVTKKFYFLKYQFLIGEYQSM